MQEVKIAWEKLSIFIRFTMVDLRLFCQLPDEQANVKLDSSYDESVYICSVLCFCEYLICLFSVLSLLCSLNRKPNLWYFASKVCQAALDKYILLFLIAICDKRISQRNAPDDEPSVCGLELQVIFTVLGVICSNFLKDL